MISLEYSLSLQMQTNLQTPNKHICKKLCHESKLFVANLVSFRSKICIEKSLAKVMESQFGWIVMNFGLQNFANTAGQTSSLLLAQCHMCLF